MMENNNKQDVKKQKQDSQSFSLRNIIITIVIAIIIFSFIFMGGPLTGLFYFIRDIGKEKIKNPDGTISIPKDAQVGENFQNPNSYVGRVMNEKIQIGRQDEFNMYLQWIMSDRNLDPYTKYQYIRYYYDQAINKIIGMSNAKKMNLIISKNYLIREIGKRYFADSEGDPDFVKMRKEPSEVNKYAKDVLKTLIYENYKYDYFKGLPVSEKEVWEEYRLENTKVSLSYINLLNDEIDRSIIEKHYLENKENYKQYKLLRLVFKAKEDAVGVLDELKKNPSKFIEMGNKLKTEGKVINVIIDQEYSFIDDFENDQLKVAVKDAGNGNVGKDVIETAVGPIIFMVQNERYADLNDSNVFQKIKSDYLALNLSNIEKANEEKAEKIYKELKSSKVESVVKKYNLKLEETKNPVSFLSYGLPNLNPDSTDDRKHIVSIFKSSINEILSPIKHSNGYMIVIVKDKIKADEQQFVNMYNDLVSKYSEEKQQDLEADYYDKERKKYQIVDNFYYVFKLQDFFNQSQTEQ